MSTGLSETRIREIQAGLRTTGQQAWLLYNFRDSNPIAARLLGIGPDVHQTRRWVAMIPAEGEPQSLRHAIEPHLDLFLPGSVLSYSTLSEYRDQLNRMLSGIDTVAMEYSPGNAIPVVSWVDAGTVELVRDLGVGVESSGELIARIESRLTPEQIESGRHAGAACREVMRNAFRFIRESLAHDLPITEYSVVERIEQDLANAGLNPHHSPICAVDANSANPHYSPTPDRADAIGEGQVVLIDLWGRRDQEGGIFGDITWTGYTGSAVPDRVTQVFNLVRDARKAGLQVVLDGFGVGENDRPVVTGADVDRAVRGVIEEGGFGEYFVHRTGHSITGELHGAGTNLDSSETVDERPLLRSTSFSIEPGIYLPGEFGIRSEIDVIIDLSGTVQVTSEPAQEEILLLGDLEHLVSAGMD